MLTTEKQNKNKSNVSNNIHKFIYYRQYFVIKIDIVILISFSYIGGLHAGQTPTKEHLLGIAEELAGLLVREVLNNKGLFSQLSVELT